MAYINNLALQKVDESANEVVLQDDSNADEDENLFGDDYNTAFVKTLLRVQNNIINLPGGREHFDIYLAETIYPVLVPGLEHLAKEIDRIINSDGKY